MPTVNRRCRVWHPCGLTTDAARPVIRDLIAHSRQQLKGSSIAKFGVALAFEHVQDVPEIAPMIRQVAGRVFHLAHPQIAMVNVRQMASPVAPRCTVARRRTSRSW